MRDATTPNAPIARDAIGALPLPTVASAPRDLDALRAWCTSHDAFELATVDDVERDARALDHFAHRCAAVGPRGRVFDARDLEELELAERDAARHPVRAETLERAEQLEGRIRWVPRPPGVVLGPRLVLRYARFSPHASKRKPDERFTALAFGVRLGDELRVVVICAEALRAPNGGPAT